MIELQAIKLFLGITEMYMIHDAFFKNTLHCLLENKTGIMCLKRVLHR